LGNINLFLQFFKYLRCGLQLDGAEIQFSCSLIVVRHSCWMLNVV